jgi:zinc transport system substrate-binding protein
MPQTHQRSLVGAVIGTKPSKMYKKIISLSLLFFIVLMGRLSHAEDRSAKIHVFVTILPHAFFVEKIAGPRASVDVMVPQGQSPHSYEPTPKQIVRLAAADIYFLAGLNIENGLLPKLKSLNKKLKLVDTRTGIKLRDMEESRHGDRTDPHVWLSPKLSQIQAKTIADALCDIDAQGCSSYKSNLELLLIELESADKRIALALAPLKGTSFFVFHPAFGYFADAYGLKQVAVETEGKEPGARQLSNFVDRAKKDGVKVIFVEPQFSTKSAAALARAVGATTVKIDPLSKDYIRNLENIAEKIKTSLEK